MGTYSPTLRECHAWLQEHCQNLSSGVSKEDGDLSITIDSTRILLNAMDAPAATKYALLTKLEQLEHANVSSAAKVQDIQALCDMCQPWLQSPSWLTASLEKSYKKEIGRVIPRLNAQEYAASWPDGWNQQTTWFRQTFVGHPYLTVISPLVPPPPHPSSSSSLPSPSPSSPTNLSKDENAMCLISVVKEDGPDHQPQFRLIIRHANETMRYLLPLATIQDTLHRLYDTNKRANFANDDETRKKSANDGHHHLRRMLQDLQDQIDAPTNAETATTTDKKSNSRHPSLHNKKRQPLRSFSAALLPNQPWTTNQHGVNHHQHHATSSSSSSLLCCHHYRLLYAAIHAVYTQLDLRQCKTLTAEATIMAGLEKELIRYDEMVTPKTYKFGILSVRDDQRAEEQWFGNTGLTRDMEAFLEILGHKVELHGYKQYAAGLDTKSGESGTHSYATQWKEHQIMFHVGPLMPFQPQDSQQIHRKRYIGNDIVCIVFMDTDQRGLFDPTAIRSQFVHVFIVVHPETSQGRPAWRIEVVQQQTVASFGPTIPSPPVFVNPRELREFLLLKLISAELSALKSDKFAVPNAKARGSMLRQMIDTGWKSTASNQQGHGASGNSSGTSSSSSSSSSSSVRSSFLLRSKMSSGELSLPSWLSHHGQKLQAVKPPRPKSAGPTGRAHAHTPTCTHNHHHNHHLLHHLPLSSSTSSSASSAVLPRPIHATSSLSTSLLARSAPTSDSLWASLSSALAPHPEHPPSLSSTSSNAPAQAIKTHHSSSQNHKRRDWKKLGRRHSTATASTNQEAKMAPPVQEDDNDSDELSTLSVSTVTTTASLLISSSSAPTTMSLPLLGALSTACATPTPPIGPLAATNKVTRTSTISLDDDWLPPLPPTCSSCSSSTTTTTTGHVTLATPSPSPILIPSPISAPVSPATAHAPPPSPIQNTSNSPNASFTTDTPASSLRTRAQLLMSSVIRRKHELRSAAQAHRANTPPCNAHHAPERVQMK